jgi:hypothetical protein
MASLFLWVAWVSGTLELDWRAPPSCPSADLVRTRLEGVTGRASVTVTELAPGWLLEVRANQSVRELRTITCEEAVEAAVLIVRLALEPSSVSPSVVAPVAARSEALQSTGQPLPWRFHVGLSVGTLVFWLSRPVLRGGIAATAEYASLVCSFRGTLHSRSSTPIPRCEGFRCTFSPTFKEVPVGPSQPVDFAQARVCLRELRFWRRRRRGNQPALHHRHRPTRRPRSSSECGPRGLFGACCPIVGASQRPAFGRLSRFSANYRGFMAGRRVFDGSRWTLLTEIETLGHRDLNRAACRRPDLGGNRLARFRFALRVDG